MATVREATFEPFRAHETLALHEAIAADERPRLIQVRVASAMWMQ